MKKFRNLLVIILSVAVGTSYAQEGVFKVSMDHDTLLMYNTLEVTFILENIQGDFIPPEFEGLRLVGGPNVSSQFSMVNGEVTQKSSYTYYLEAVAPGTATISAAGLNDGTSVIETGPLTITVLPNPNGVVQQKGRYGFEQVLTYKDSTMSKMDSLKMKIKKLKTKKI